MRTLLTLLSALLLSSGALFAQEEMSLEAGEGIVLRGTLLMPAGVEKPPVALIIAGSGPTDRDGNSPQMQNNSLKNLAEDLQKVGIATFRYDKRGIAKSAFAGMREEDVILENFADDALKLASMLCKDGRFSEVVVAGHSEGAQLAVMAAIDNPEISKVVCISGLGRPMDAVIIEQLERNPHNPAALIAESKTILESLKKGERVAKVSPVLMPLFRPSVQPFMISSIRQNPTANIAKLTCPVMIVQGGTDIQITKVDMDALAAAQPKATQLYIEDMNHILKKTADLDMAAQMHIYADPTIPNHEALAPAIAKFIKEK